MAFIKHVLCVGLIVCGLSGGVSHGAADSRCFADWSEAGPVARKQALVPVAGVLKTVRAKSHVRVARVQLCREHDTFHYRVAIFDTSGSLSWIQVNARTGRIETLVRP